MNASHPDQSIQFYDTLTRSKVDFAPDNPENVRMYVCGPTVYDRAHIGNARPIIVFDVVFRLLRQYYGAEHVTYARNITDVDDKINARASERGVSIQELTEQTIAEFHADITELGVLEPTVEPRATGHIEEMKAMCEELVAKDHAYVAEGHVLFSVSSMADYGQLSGRSTDELMAGARVDVAPYKRDPMDFVLWKPSKAGEPSWPSPCGIEQEGRPGWHIECSAMSARHLGKVFDIHGGGIDLVFPHHENEVAQSRSVHGTPRMAKVWMHNGFLQVEGEKMSKSLGNFITIREALDEAPGEANRLAMLATHYRQPINWTRKGVAEARRTLDHWYELTEGLPADGPVCADVLDALRDDLNTPKAIAALHELRSAAAKGARPAAACLKASAQLLGLLQLTRADWLAWRPAAVELDETRIGDLISLRLAARKAKDWPECDRIRDELMAMGIQLKDGKDPATGEPTTTWEVGR